MILKSLYIVAFIAITITLFIAYQDRNLAVLTSIQIPVKVKAVSFPNSAQPGMKYGELIWRGGLSVTSSHQRFGGLSGLEISSDGKNMLAVTDKGLWFKARLGYDQDGGLLSLSHGFLSSINGTKGNALTRKKDRDSESLARAEDGAIYISFERRHRILKYSGPFETSAEAIPLPEAFTHTSKNKGIEALTWLPGGCLLAIPERIETPNPQSGPQSREPLIEAFLWDQYSWRTLYLESNANFLPTGLSVTPGGDLLLLERRFSFFDGFETSLRIFPAEQIQPGGIMKGHVLANFEGQHAIDNMEGISSRLGQNGETLVYLLSDDNLSFTQDTLLLMFEIDSLNQEQRKPAGFRTAGCSKNKSAYSAALEAKAF